jgi:hypothetical protein
MTGKELATPELDMSSDQCVDCPPLAAPTVTVELFGVPRLLLGQGHVAVTGETLAEVARMLLAAAPALAGPVLDPATGWPNAGYTFVIDERFTRDPATPVTAASSVLLVSSVAGG